MPFGQYNVSRTMLFSRTYRLTACNTYYEFYVPRTIPDGGVFNQPIHHNVPTTTLVGLYLIGQYAMQVVQCNITRMIPVGGYLIGRYSEPFGRCNVPRTMLVGRYSIGQNYVIHDKLGGVRARPCEILAKYESSCVRARPQAR